MKQFFRQIIRRPEEAQIARLDTEDVPEVETAYPEGRFAKFYDLQRFTRATVETEDYSEFETAPEDCTSKIADEESEVARFETLDKLEVEIVSDEDEIEPVYEVDSVCDSFPPAGETSPSLCSNALEIQRERDSLSDELRATKSLLMKEQCRNSLRTSDMGKQVAELKTSLEQLQEQIDAARAERQTAQEAEREAQRDVQTLVVMLQARNELDREQEELRKSVRTLQGQLQQTQDELSSKQTKCEELSCRHAQCYEQNLQEEKKRIALEEKLQETKQNLEQSNANLVSSKMEEESLRFDMEKLREEKTTLEKMLQGQLQQTQDELSRKQTEYEKLSCRHAQCCEQNLQEEKKRIALEEKLQETKQNLEQSNANLIDTLKHELAEERKKSANLQQQLLLPEKGSKRKMDSPFPSIDVGSLPKQIRTQFFTADRNLRRFDLQGIADYISEWQCKKVVVMCGAGISTSSGIIDFRTPGTGLYDNLKKFSLPRPEAVFDLNYFRTRPAPFYELAKDIWPGNYQPSPAHYFIKLLSSKGILQRCYSQNFDSLESEAGLPRESLVAAHGNFDGANVLDTDPVVDVDISELKSALDNGEAGWQALREKFGNLVRPNIVFFGDSLPKRFQELREEDLRSCDLLIVMGTSLVVGPFNELVGMPLNGVPRVLINNEIVGTCDKLHKGFLFGTAHNKHNWRDVFYQGACDEGCRTLAAALGWDQDLERLIETRGTASISRASWL